MGTTSPSTTQTAVSSAGIPGERLPRPARAAGYMISVLLNCTEQFTGDVWSTNLSVLSLQAWGLAVGFNEEHVKARWGGTKYSDL